LQSLLTADKPLLFVHRLQSFTNAVHFFKSLHLIFNRFSSLTSRYYLFELARVCGKTHKET
jgi:hypothetical protein